MNIGITNTNKLVSCGHYLCGHTESVDQIVEQFEVSVDDILTRLQSVIRPVKRAELKRQRGSFINLDQDQDFHTKLNEALMRLLAEELTQ